MSVARARASPFGDECDPWVWFRFHGASATLNPDGTLSVSGAGNAIGCGSPVPDFTFSFTGSK